jgi:hypothetical protein
LLNNGSSSLLKASAEQQTDQIIDNAIELTLSLINVIPHLCQNCKLLLKQNVVFGAPNAPNNRRPEYDAIIATKIDRHDN